MGKKAVQISEMAAMIIKNNKKVDGKTAISFFKSPYATFTTSSLLVEIRKALLAHLGRYVAKQKTSAVN